MCGCFKILFGHFPGGTKETLGICDPQTSDFEIYMYKKRDSWFKCQCLIFADNGYVQYLRLHYTSGILFSLGPPEGSVQEGWSTKCNCSRKIPYRRLESVSAEMALSSKLVQNSSFQSCFNIRRTVTVILFL